MNFFKQCTHKFFSILYKGLEVRNLFFRATKKKKWDQGIAIFFKTKGKILNVLEVGFFPPVLMIVIVYGNVLVEKVSWVLKFFCSLRLVISAFWLRKYLLPRNIWSLNFIQPIPRASSIFSFSEIVRTIFLFIRRVFLVYKECIPVVFFTVRLKNSKVSNLFRCISI